MRKLFIIVILVMVFGLCLGCAKKREALHPELETFKVFDEWGSVILIHEKQVLILRPYLSDIRREFEGLTGIFIIYLDKRMKRGVVEYICVVFTNVNAVSARGSGKTPGQAIRNIEWYMEPIYSGEYSYRDITR